MYPFSPPKVGSLVTQVVRRDLSTVYFQNTSLFRKPTIIKLLFFIWSSFGLDNKRSRWRDRKDGKQKRKRFMRVSATVCLRSSNSSSKVTFFVQYMVPSARVESFTCGTKLHCSRSKIWFCWNCLPVRIFAQAVFLQNHSLLWMGKRERLLADYS